MYSIYDNDIFNVHCVRFVINVVINVKFIFGVLFYDGLIDLIIIVIFI